jgi:hypothetical protein
MTRTYVGIDFSLNNPAFCVYSEDTQKPFWWSLHKTSNKLANIYKNPNSPLTVLKEESRIIISVKEKLQYSKEYLEEQREKFREANLVVDELFEVVKTYTGFPSSVFVAIEGISFGSSGNSLVDISLATSLLRKKIVDYYGHDRLFVVPPSAIKKYAYKGNAKKHEMYEALMQREDLFLKNFQAIFSSKKEFWVREEKVTEPCSDLFDATWTMLYLKNLLNPVN